jgi:hypothetical protein
MICEVPRPGPSVLERILVAIRSARPRMTLRARAVIEAVVLSRGSIGSAQAVARVLGLTNRFQLARLLEHEGLPPLHRITDWVTVLNWLDSAEREDVSLCWLAFRSHRHPSACYRLVKRVTGHGWEDVHTRGSAWVLGRFLNALRSWSHRRPYHPIAPLRVPQLAPPRRSNPHPHSQFRLQ